MTKHKISHQTEIYGCKIQLTTANSNPDHENKQIFRYKFQTNEMFKIKKYKYLHNYLTITFKQKYFFKTRY